MPRPEIVDQALQQIGKSAANYRYFFEKLNSPSWLAPLAEKGRFSAPPRMVEVDGGVMFPPWPESQYLARMARVPEVQDQVLRIVRDMPATDNVNVRADLMDVALALPPNKSAELVDRAVTWVQNRFEGLVGSKVADLIVHLANGGHAQAALRLAGAALALEPAIPVDDDRDWAPAPEPRAHLRDWNYEKTLKKAVPALIAANSGEAFVLLCGLLDRAVVLSRRSNEQGEHDYSYIWHEAIEQDEHPARLRNSLVSAARNAAESIIQQQPEALKRVLAELRRHQWSVFKRLELHVLNRFSDLAAAEIVPLALQLAAVEPSTHHEAAQLLKTAFSRLPPATQDQVLTWINAGPGEDYIRQGLEFAGRQPTPELTEQLTNRWRAQRFALFADQVPVAWRERVDAVLAGAGEVGQLEALQHRGGWVGPTSPKSAAELQEMGPASVIAFLRAWEAPRGHLVNTPEGLGRALGDVISHNPEAYVEHAMAFSRLDPTFVRFFFSGLETAIQEHRPVPWPAVLSLAQWVIQQPREIAGRHTELMEADDGWQWTRGAIANLLSDGLNQREVTAEELPTSPIPFDERNRLWAIIEPLTRDPDPTPDHEVRYGGDNMDPPTLAINSVRGKAMSAVVAYALWVRHYLDRFPERPPATLEVMPEAQTCLDAHLDVAQEPSLAIRSVYGRFFPQLYRIGPAWARDARPKIFPTAEGLTTLYAAAWDAYLMFSRPYNEVFLLLTHEYLHAVQQLAVVDSKNDRGINPRTRLTEHLMTYFWWGTLSRDAELFVSFFQMAPDELRGRAIDFLGRSLVDQSDTPIEAPILERLRMLWESRVANARAVQKPRQFREELSHFGWWFSSRRFPPAWSFEQLHAVLAFVKHIEPEFMVAEVLEALATEHPLECVRAVHLMALSDTVGWELHANEEHFRKIVATAVGSGNAKARAAADDVIQYLITRGRFSYRELL